MTGYGDPEILVAGWLHDLLAIKTWADPNIPADWRFKAPVAHVQRLPALGSAPLSIDRPDLSIDVYAAVADHAREAAADIWAAMTLQLPLTTFQPSGIFVKHVAAAPPAWARDPQVYKRTATYSVTLHGLVP